jgi:hypothetical protein
VNGQFYALTNLPLGKELVVCIGYEAGWMPELVWMLWSRKKSLAPTENRTPAFQFISIPTEIIRPKDIVEI